MHAKNHLNNSQNLKIKNLIAINKFNQITISTEHPSKPYIYLNLQITFQQVQTINIGNHYHSLYLHLKKNSNSKQVAGTKICSNLI